MIDSETKKSEAMVAAMDNFDLSGPSKDASCIKNAIPWNVADYQFDEYGDADDEYHARGFFTALIPKQHQ